MMNTVSVRADDIVLRRPRRHERIKQWVRSLFCLGHSSAQDEATKPRRIDVTRTPTRHPPSIYDPLSKLCKHQDPRLLYTPPPLLKIGEGRSGAVYRANGRGLAIKEMKVPLRPQLRTRLVAEITALQEMARRGGNRNVLRYEDAYIYKQGADKKVWLISEDAEHGQLTRVITRLKLNELQMSVVMRQLLKALQYVHAGGWVHCDVKSDNIFIASDGHVILGDFGAAEKVQGGGEDKLGAISGTPHWMSPETVIANEYTQQSDIWSAGIVLHEMLMGEPPYWHLAQDEVMNQLALFTKLDTSEFRGSDYLKDFLSNLIAVKQSRMSIEQAFEHPFISMYADQPEDVLLPAIEKLKRMV